MDVKKIILGILVGLSVFGIIVYSVNTDKSLIQLFIGFILFIFPIMFISSFGSTFAAFTLTIYVAVIGYIIYIYKFYDTLIGLLLAIIIGGAIAFFRIGKYEIFSSKEYIKDSVKNMED